MGSATLPPHALEIQRAEAAWEQTSLALYSVSHLPAV